MRVRKPKLEGALQRESYQKSFAIHYYTWLTARYWGIILAKPRMYFTLQKEHYLNQTASDVRPTIRNCQDCTRLWGTPFKHQKVIRLFFATRLLELIPMDVLRPLKKTGEEISSFESELNGAPK